MTFRFSGAIVACLGGLLSFIGQPLCAAGLDSVLTGQPTTADFIEKLRPKPKTRSLARGIRPKLPTVDLPIVSFEFDSAELTPIAREVLDHLAEALLSAELAGSRFLIEGHTDSVGTEHYNQGLSERRAASVGAYLTMQRVDPSRLNLLGMGEIDLLNPENGKAAINRRVRVINLGG
ncbi:MAG: OmpA family protein [Alphaproteobacteria bacterium]|nr:OmpA family protein [Alphaproteobacteria bacterium]